MLFRSVTVGDGDESYPGEWTLFGIAARGLVDTFTVPDEDAAPAADVSSAGRSR